MPPQTTTELDTDVVKANQALVNPTISSADLSGSPTPIQLPPLNQQDPRELQGVATSVNDIVARSQAPTQTAQTQDDIIARILSDVENLQGRDAAQFAAEEQAGIPEQNRQLTQLTGRLQQLQAEALAIPLQIQNEFQGTGATRGGVEPVQTARLRENAIQSLTIGAQAQALQGNIELAQQQVNRAVDLQFKPIEDRLQYLQTAYALNKDVLEREDKQRAQRLEIELNERARVLSFAKEEENKKNELAILATQFGIDASDALNSQSYTEALQSIVPALSQARGEEREVQNFIALAELEGKRLANQNAKLTAQKIAVEIANERNKGKLSDDETTAEVEKALAVFTQAQKVLSMPGLSAAVGFGIKKSAIARTVAGAATGAGVGGAAGLPFGGVGAIPGAIGGAVIGGAAGLFAGPEAIRGSARADFEAEAERLANLLTVDNLDLMSGVLSETDIKILESAGSILGSFDISEEKYIEELNRVMDVAKRNYTKMGLTAEQAEFYFGFSKEDIAEVDSILNPDTALTPGQFDPLNYYSPIR